jgi:hypothetical protein
VLDRIEVYSRLVLVIHQELALITQQIP